MVDAASWGQALEQGWRAIDRDPAAVRDQAAALLARMPGQADVALLLAAARRRLGEVAAAREAVAPAMPRWAGNPVAWFEWAMILFAMGEEAQAAQALRRAVALQPGFAAAWRTLGDVLMVLGDGLGADRAYAQAARAAVRDPRLAIAGAALGDGQPAVAERLLQAHLRQVPDDPRALHLLGDALVRLNRVPEAEAAYAACLSVAPGYGEARHSLAAMLNGLTRFGEAAAQFRQLVTKAPYQPALRVLFWTCLTEVGDFTSAMPLYEAALAAWRAQPHVLLRYAHALKTLGRPDEAVAAYRACIALAPSRAAAAYLSLADVKTAQFTDAEIAAMTALTARSGVRDEDAAQLHYALGRAREQRGEFEAAFGHFAEGGRRRRRGLSYDPDVIEAYAGEVSRVFTPALFAIRASAGCATDAPIFVVGMPRSGSTLVEQILASHPAVEGTFELEALGAIATELQGGAPASALPAIVASMDDASRARLGARYLEAARPFRLQGKPRFIDKMPDNFRHVGLIQLILPQARIVDVRRAPMAAGLAVFKQHFQAKQSWANYTYDLTDIGRYRRAYVAIMAQFDAALPGRVHLVHYERLVTDTEAEVRVLLAYCGLAFEPGCLRFWETERAVRTPSAQQVRQPIFREGLEQWRHYAPWLGPLRDALGPLAEGMDENEGLCR